MESGENKGKEAREPHCITKKTQIELKTGTRQRQQQRKNRNDPDRATDRMGKRRVSEEKEGEWKPWLLLLTVNLTLYLKLHFKIFPLDDVPSFHFHLLVVLFLECCTSHPLIILTLVVLLLLVLLLTAAARFLTFFAEGGGG